MKKKLILSLIFVIFSCIVYLFPRPALAEVYLDTDFDGITDNAENSVYKTDPKKWDTDGDGFSDSQEIVNNTNPLDTNNNPIAINDPKKVPLISDRDPIAWYISRISGIVAFILFTYVVAFGLFQTSKAYFKFKFLSAPLAMEIHRLIAWLGLFVVILHFGILFFDDYIKFTYLEVLVPFLVKRNITSSVGFGFTLPIAMGIVGFYTIVILIATSELRRKIVSAKIWRMIHYTSFVGYLLFLGHGVLAGTDTKEPWMIAIYIGSATITMFLLMLRIFAKKIFYPKIPARTAPTMNMATPVINKDLLPNNMVGTIQ